MHVPQLEPESLALLRDGLETGDHSRLAPHAGESIPNYEIEVVLDYTFDEHGNLLSWSKGGVSRPQPTDGATNHLTRGTFDAAGNLTILDDPGMPGDRVTFSFDALTRIVARQGETDAKPLYFLYTADDERALILDPDPQRSEWFRYSLRDFGGRLVRMATEVNPTEIAPGPVFAAEQDVIFRGGAPLAFVASNSSTGLHLSLDHLGSIRLGTASEGQVLGWRRFYPFGEQATYPPDQVPLTLMFTGHERQSFNGLTADDDLDYMHARVRSPLTGRFLSVDPLIQLKRAMKMPQLWNRYSYAVGNPLKYIDPTGETINLVFDFAGIDLDMRQQILIARGIKARFVNAGVKDVKVHFKGGLFKGNDKGGTDATVHLRFVTGDVGGEGAFGITSGNPPGNKSEISLSQAPSGETPMLNFLINVGSHEVGHGSQALPQFNMDAAPVGSILHPVGAERGSVMEANVPAGTLGSGPREFSASDAKLLQEELNEEPPQ